MEVAVASVVPRMIVLDPAAGAIPITFVEISAVVHGSDPGRTYIRRTRPVSVMPPVATPDRVPISPNPCVTGAGIYWYCNNSGRRRRANCDSNRYSGECHSRGKQGNGK